MPSAVNPTPHKSHPADPQADLHPTPAPVTPGPAVRLWGAHALYLDEQLVTGQAMAIDGQGRIVAIAPLSQLRAQFPGLPEDIRADAVLFPGFVNSHSHAFQRLIRGRTASVPAHDRSADFWSWRTAMYQVAGALSPEALEQVSAMTYLEMLKAGITSVAEFHYVHHQADGTPYADPTELSQRVVAAAQEAGVRMTLLPVAYHQAGFGRPILPEQRRFQARTLDQFLQQLEQTRTWIPQEQPSLAFGVAAHSVRAVPESWLLPLRDYAQAHRLPLHIHAAEQVPELEQCLAATGMTPVRLLAHHGFLTDRTVLVHATHLDASELDAIAQAGSSVSVCPTTERDLGDGILNGDGLLQRGVRMSLGSDSHVQIDMFAEMRCLEGHERLRLRKRNVLIEPPRFPGEGESELASAWSVVPGLWRSATERGAPDVGLPVGRFAPGLLADGFTVPLDHLVLEGATLSEIPALLLASGHPGCVRDVFVGGQWVVEGGVHRQEGSIRRAYRQVAQRIFGG